MSARALKTLAHILRAPGAAVLCRLRSLGALSIFTLLAVRHIFRPKQLSKIFVQIRLIGANSLFLILLISTFTGLVLGLQSYVTLAKFSSEGALGTLVSLSLIRELGPVLTAIMIAGRAGSAMAAEIGVMRISEQLDALEVMDIDPIGFLVSPRVAACLIIFPLMTAVFNTVGILGGFVAGTIIMNGDGGVYFYRADAGTVMRDITLSLMKSVVFAVIVASVSCYKGFFVHLRTDGAGPAAVNNATTSAVVSSCILVLIADYIVTSLFI